MKFRIISGALFFASLAMLIKSCSIDHNSEPPETGSLVQGIRTSAVIGYCSAIAVSAHKNLSLPPNAERIANNGLINIRIDNQFPIPFVNGNGNILIASLWNQNGGIMSVLLTGIDPSGGKSNSFGLYAVPISEDPDEACITAVYADQDIIIGNGSDTILDLSNISGIFLNSRLDLLDSDEPDDPFIAVKQNFWVVKSWPNGTHNYLYDDDVIISGGGQIAEVNGSTGGIIYHAMIQTRLNYHLCSRNPVSGHALSQNFKAGGDPLIDLGNSLLRFHPECNGRAHVEISTGKYFGYTGRDINLNLN